jgi:ribosomal protein S18 acetylase RimI-like enzyme
MTDIYNESFKDNWGFIPLSISESIFMTKQFLTIADEKLIWYANINGNPAGFVLALPNINEILSPLNGSLFHPSIIPFLVKKKNIRSYRVLVLCVNPRYRGLGIESILINQIRKRVCEKPYSFGEHSIVLENNLKMIRVLEAIGLKLFKRYRIYKAII